MLFEILSKEIAFVAFPLSIIFSFSPLGAYLVKADSVVFCLKPHRINRMQVQKFKK